MSTLQPSNRPPKASPTIGLALGGGGARGLAHIGVLKVLEENHIPVDFIAGTSIGGVIGAAYAANVTISEIEKLALQFANPRQMVRLMGLSRHGLIETSRLRAWFESFLGKEAAFESLRIPLSVVATDIDMGRELVLDSGPLIEAVMATSAFPGIFPLVERDGCRLSDGGCLNNVPADVVRKMGADIVIAVNVNWHFPRPLDQNNEHHIHALPRYLPPALQEAYQTALIMIAALTDARLDQNKPDLVIHPDLPEDLSIFLGFSRAAEVIAIGEQAAILVLPQIQAVLEMPVSSTDH